MRTSLMALGLALAACGRSERAPAAATAAPVAPRHGLDLLVLRTPRAGGPVRVFAFPRLDSLVWTSTAKAPVLERVVGFDDVAGTVLAEAPKGVLVRIDLRLGTVDADEAPRLRAVVSADGSTAFGVAPDGRVVRVTPAGTWSFKPPEPPRAVMPQPDGQLLVLADRPNAAVVWSVRPPDSATTDTIPLPAVARAVSTPVGDRVYFTAGDQLLILRVRPLALLPSVALARSAGGLVTTPSGDRIYAALDSVSELVVLDRYTGKIAAQITLPTPAIALRMDPLGRLLLARTKGDSTIVIAEATDRVVGIARGVWRADLPAVAPNGWVAVASGNDVIFLDGDSLVPRRTVSGGARDLWSFLAWNGFRPRAAELDIPVSFPEDTIVARDSLVALARALAADSARASTAESLAHGPATAGTEPTARDTAPRGPQFTVQFAALRTDSAARRAASTIHVTGVTPRVVANAHDGVITFRVVIGPFGSRDEAERIARTAGMSYWIYEGPP